jgi:hypothetical protein
MFEIRPNQVTVLIPRPGGRIRARDQPRHTSQAPCSGDLCASDYTARTRKR